MKVIFVYSNGKTFTANGVATESLAIDVNEHGDKIVSYTRESVPLVLPQILAEALETSAAIRAKSLSKGMTRISDDAPELDSYALHAAITGSETYHINARITGLDFLVIKPQDDDDDSFNNLDAYGTKTLTFVPVLKDFTGHNVVDALRIF